MATAMPDIAYANADFASRNTDSGIGAKFSKRAAQINRGKHAAQRCTAANAAITLALRTLNTECDDD